MTAKISRAQINRLFVINNIKKCTMQMNRSRDLVDIYSQVIEKTFNYSNLGKAQKHNLCAKAFQMHTLALNYAKLTNKVYFSQFQVDIRNVDTLLIMKITGTLNPNYRSIKLTERLIDPATYDLWNIPRNFLCNLN